ncbi:MAG: excalibur calcium-binding domain-containing protein [Mycetocola sp.]
MIRRRTAAAALLISALALTLSAGPAQARPSAPVSTQASVVTVQAIAIKTQVTAASVRAGGGPVQAKKKVTVYKNCTALNKKYPHGVGLKKAKDKVKGKTKPVTNFTRNDAVYKANKKSDRDKDGIACEKR